MQATSDIFLGWTKGVEENRHLYWRQLRDMKGSVVVESMAPANLSFYARTCGWTLARAHARSGDAVAISAYLGKGDGFDRAIADFSRRYADQNEPTSRRFLKPSTPADWRRLRASRPTGLVGVRKRARLRMHGWARGSPARQFADTESCRCCRDRVLTPSRECADLIRLGAPSRAARAQLGSTDPGKRRSIVLALNLVPFAGIAFLWFMGVIKDRIGEREDRFFATVFLGSGLLFVGLLFVGAAMAVGMLASPGMQKVGFPLRSFGSWSGG